MRDDHFAESLIDSAGEKNKRQSPSFLGSVETIPRRTPTKSASAITKITTAWSPARGLIYLLSNVLHESFYIIYPGSHRRRQMRTGIRKGGFHIRSWEKGGSMGSPPFVCVSSERFTAILLSRTLRRVTAKTLLSARRSTHQPPSLSLGSDIVYEIDRKKCKLPGVDMAVPCLLRHKVEKRRRHFLS